MRAFKYVGKSQSCMVTVDGEGPHQAKARYCKAYTEYRSTLSKWKTVATCLSE